jgi:hypothetical protein
MGKNLKFFEILYDILLSKCNKNKNYMKKERIDKIITIGLYNNSSNAYSHIN